MAVFAEHIPKHDRARFALEIGNAEFLRAFGYLRIVATGLAHPSKVSLNVRHEDWDAAGAEAFGERLQRDCLSRARRPGNKAMAVCHFRKEINRFGTLGDEDRVSHK